MTVLIRVSWQMSNFDVGNDFQTPYMVCSTIEQLGGHVGSQNLGRMDLENWLMEIEGNLADQNFARLVKSLPGPTFTVEIVPTAEMIQCLNCLTTFARQIEMRRSNRKKVLDVQFCPACGVTLHGLPTGFTAIRQTNRSGSRGR